MIQKYCFETPPHLPVKYKIFNKLFASGSVAKSGWFRPYSSSTRFTSSPEKRHIGALARLGWLPSFRHVRRFNRSGRSTSSDDICRLLSMLDVLVQVVHWFYVWCLLSLDLVLCVQIKILSKKKENRKFSAVQVLQVIVIKFFLDVLVHDVVLINCREKRVSSKRLTRTIQKHVVVYVIILLDVSKCLH